MNNNEILFENLVEIIIIMFLIKLIQKANKTILREKNFIEQVDHMTTAT